MACNLILLSRYRPVFNFTVKLGFCWYKVMANPRMCINPRENNILVIIFFWAKSQLKIVSKDQLACNLILLSRFRTVFCFYCKVWFLLIRGFAIKPTICTIIYYRLIGLLLHFKLDILHAKKAHTYIKFTITIVTAWPRCA